MTSLIQISELSHTIAGKRLFENLQVNLNSNDRIGLVGHNGAGKSTLLKLVDGKLAADSGAIAQRKGLRIAAVEQFLPQDLDKQTLVDAVGLERWRAEAMLLELGFSDRDFALNVGDLSGGQQNRLMFARAVIQAPDVLLLDEPTNHLDLYTIVLFERYLRDLKAAFVLVSHDRSFLDAVTNCTWVLRDARIYQFQLPFSAARDALAQHDQAAAHAAKQEDNKIDALRASAKRLNMWGKVYDNEKLARRGRAIERRADKLAANKTFTTEGSPLSLGLHTGASKAKEILRIEDYRVTVGTRHLFSIEEFLVRPGERVALLGHNGVGKSTLIKQLVEGSREHIRLRPQTRLGYYDQELEEAQGGSSMLDFVLARTDANDDSARRGLIHAGFAYADHGNKISTLSGGERARVLFVVLSLRAPNFLVLDEPTNHIDLEGKEQLEQQLCDGSAAVLLTSHDRRFIETVAQRYVWIRDGRLTELNDPQKFFDSAPEVSPQVRGEALVPSSTDTSLDQDSALQRLLELEAKLSDDLARKAKFQKPALQAEWRAEITRLYEQLDET